MLWYLAAGSLCWWWQCSTCDVISLSATFRQCYHRSAPITSDISHFWKLIEWCHFDIFLGTTPVSACCEFRQSVNRSISPEHWHHSGVVQYSICNKISVHNPMLAVFLNQFWLGVLQKLGSVVTCLRFGWFFNNHFCAIYTQPFNGPLPGPPR